MRSTLSSLFKSSAFAQETGEVFLVFLTISGAGMTTLRLVNNYSNITSGGNTYQAYPFEITLPTDSDESIPEVTISIDNVDRQIVQGLRSLTAPPTVSMFVALASTPNTVEIGPISLTLREASYDAVVVSGTLLPEDMLNEPFPGDSFTPANFPALF